MSEYLSLRFRFENKNGLELTGDVKQATGSQLVEIIEVLNKLGKIVNGDKTITGEEILDEIYPADPNEAFKIDGTSDSSRFCNSNDTTSNSHILD